MLVKNDETNTGSLELTENTNKKEKQAKFKLRARTNFYSVESEMEKLSTTMEKQKYECFIIFWDLVLYTNANDLYNVKVSFHY